MLIDGTVEMFAVHALPADLADAFAAKLWDVREDTKPYAFFRITPQRIQVWREENELRGRDIMLDGEWVV